MKSKLEINDFAVEIMDWRKHHQFHTPTSLETEFQRDQMLGKLMLVVTEIGEAAEAVRHNDVSNFQEELADTFIRLMDITAACGIDIETEIEKKMEVNWKRPIKHDKHCSL